MPYIRSANLDLEYIFAECRGCFIRGIGIQRSDTHLTVGLQHGQ